MSATLLLATVQTGTFVDSLSSLLKKYNLRPRKELGQNFLTDPIHLAKIIDIAGLTPADTVLEIGPGPGVLTCLLAEAAGQVIAVELDPQMVNLLKNEYGHLHNLTIVEADILQTNLNTLISQQKNLTSHIPHPTSHISYKVVANLPYYITSAVLRHLLEATPQPERVVVTVQKEVAQRMVAKPGQMSLLAISVQFYGQPTLAHHIPAGAFYPAPKVDSAVVRIDTFAQPPVAVTDVDHFFQVVRAGFGQKRKQLKNSLAAGLAKPMPEVMAALDQAKIDSTRRAETLSLEEWGWLAAAL
ncbi:MAG TPA: 16S rRNA (adenine(1518)-N(6)/adenine(1519)-N(6))-dimethyltransferase RsmA [Anaerolineae bacterium]|nr:16S rRNA (adenine(1518)-N(6)/adenine(1519)-N(6))-dimethyltransferase RsmA [Anaerolineae bacterium]